MTSITRFFSSIKSVYNNINPSTLTGAIDTIVVKQEDGTLRCTPFHVRFGKLSILQSQQNQVYIRINGVSVDHICMQIGEAGEAVFIEEVSGDPTNISSSPIRHLEPSNAHSSLDPDRALSLTDHPQLSNIDRSPQIVNQALDGEKSSSIAPPPVQVDVLHSEVIVPSNGNRRSTKHRSAVPSTSDDDDDDEEQIIPAQNNKRRSRARRRDPVELNSSLSQSEEDEPTTSPTAAGRRDASENETNCFQFDDDTISQSSAPFVDAHSRFNSIDSRQKPLLPRSTRVQFQVDQDDNDDDDDESYTSSQEDSLQESVVPMKTTRASSNPIPIESMNKPDRLETVIEANSLINALLSHSAPSATIDKDSPKTVPVRMHEENDSTPPFELNGGFSPSSSLPESTTAMRPPSPKSDTEYERDKASQKSSRRVLGWRWKWGELPEQRRNVLRYFWPSASSSSTTTNNLPRKASPVKDGVYLHELTGEKSDDRARYLPQMDYDQQSRQMKDDDQESGRGISLPTSPVREHEHLYLLGDVQLSLCGHLQKLSEMTDDVFNAHLVSYETFANNPSIVNNRNLVARIAGQYHTWDVASALIASTSIYHKYLPPEAIERLQDKASSPSKTRSSNSGSWWPFSGRKSEVNEEHTVFTPAEALAMVMKSEVVAPIGQDHFNRKHSNNSEQEDDEVRKLLERFEQKQQQQQQQQQPSKPQVKKSLILSSDQLKRLNLKAGMNRVEFSVTTAIQGTTIVEANIFFFDHLTKFVISDIDGTITKSDVFGHILPLMGRDWSHEGIAEFFRAIQENGYQFIYLSARAIGQSRITRNFLRNLKQCGYALPDGPLLISPDTLVTALYREVIAKRPEDFKIECLKNIASLFPNQNPFYAGFGNRTNDQYAYTTMGIPETRIFTINPRGEVVRQKISQVLSTSYRNLHEVVDQVFPPMDSFAASEAYSSFNFWREEPKHSDSLEDEMRAHLTEMFQRQKSKSGKGVATSSSGVLPKTTATTTVTKNSGEKLLTIAQATENTVKGPK